MNITTSIIPDEQRFVGLGQELDLRAICIFIATGFFLDNDTYYKNLSVLKPARHYKLDPNQNILEEKPYFKWYYNPIERDLDDVVEEFGDLFETIIKEQSQDKKVILPLSGGLDSRTQAVAFKRLNIPVKSYSYQFLNGHKETRYAKKIADKCNFPFYKYVVDKGYLWSSIESLAEINKCYSEFTHPRQMAFIKDLKVLGNQFSLGHWGDVLFDDMRVEANLSLDAQVEFIIKKTVKKAGLHLAKSLWKIWGFTDEFEYYLRGRISKLLSKIDIADDANARLRAFKSLYWSPRWTSVNLSIFKHVNPIALPYYDNRMCNFICTVPERYLEGRKIQIEYIKSRMPELAEISWQDHRPFNLFNYKYNKLPYNLPYRIKNKATRMVSSKRYVQRNWELQFLGEQNDAHLKDWLLNNSNLKQLVPEKLCREFYNHFKHTDPIQYAHAVSMLLTLSLFTKQNTFTNFE